MTSHHKTILQQLLMETLNQTAQTPAATYHMYKQSSMAIFECFKAIPVSWTDPSSIPWTGSKNFLPRSCMVLNHTATFRRNRVEISRINTYKQRVTCPSSCFVTYLGIFEGKREQLRREVSGRMPGGGRSLERDCRLSMRLMFGCLC